MTPIFRLMPILLLLVFIPKLATSMVLRQSISNQTHVSTILAKHLFSKEFANSNVVFSPLSMHVIMSILAAGSQGQTQDQILSFLKTNTSDDLNSLYSQLVPWILADGSPSGGPRLSFVNGVWVDETVSLEPSFKHVVDTVYKAAWEEVDFKNKAIEVVNEINSWAEKQTNGLIKKVLPNDAVDDLTRLVLANAIYFNGAWSKKFHPRWTEEYDFHLLDGNKVKVPFMTNKRDQVVLQYDDFKVLGLPYVQGQDKRKFTMYFFLPDAKDGIQSLVKKIGSMSDFFDRHIPHQEVEVGRFLIPKFKFSFGFEASNMLKKLGVVLPFDEHNADFRKMVNLSAHERLHVSRFYHKSVMEVSEEGTEASSISCVRGTLSMKPFDAVDFVADHPFLFMIREDVSGVVLFMGQVTNPSVA